MPGTLIWSKKDLLELGRYQRWVQWAVLASLLTIFLRTGIRLVDLGLYDSTAMAIVYVSYRYFRALKLKGVPLLAVLTIVPAFGLLEIVIFVRKGTKILRANGIAVGFMGAKVEALKKELEPGSMTES